MRHFTEILDDIRAFESVQSLVLNVVDYETPACPHLKAAWKELQEQLRDRQTYLRFVAYLDSLEFDIRERTKKAKELEELNECDRLTLDHVRRMLGWSIHNN
jgi:hypothetical protein